ncbi:hypothetical protein [Bradyrhizobium sp. 61]|uniref:hypothetical protein n=1 Tax=unclassified Bradyrhizobium TaxID=2631580 RepID=UPI001FFBAB00|nr:hypothetical protein [Bradyrhizobium sp. 61]MCK1279470.1 hypothetical protein [Bradyrhizobium sp. 61]
MAKTKSEPTLIERIRAVHPRYADLLEAQERLLARQAIAQAEALPLGQEERRALLGWVVQQPKSKPRPIVRHAGAVDLVGDLLSPQPETEVNPPPSPPTWAGEKRSRELGAELEAIAEALKLLAPEITKARKEYSKLVVAQRGQEYKAVAEAVVSAACALGDAILAHHHFITAQRLDGVAYSMYRPLNLERFGNVDESGSPLMRTIVDAVEQKHVGAGKIPDWKMPADITLFAGGN